MNLPSTSRLATDTHSIDSLRSRAATDPKAAIKEVAKQFEALFMQELMKSMRAAQESMASGMFDNSGTKMGTEMLDTQFATKMTGLRGGLSEAIARQLERQMSATPAQALMPAAAAGAPRVSGQRNAAPGCVPQRPSRCRTRCRSADRHPGHLHGRAGGA